MDKIPYLEWLHLIKNLYYNEKYQAWVDINNNVIFTRLDFLYYVSPPQKYYTTAMRGWGWCYI